MKAMTAMAVGIAIGLWILMLCLSSSALAGMTDNDQDGMDDDWERLVGLQPGLMDQSGDPDKDGLTNLEEWQSGSDPFEADSDGDGLSDEEEVNRYQTNPGLADTDGGGLSDGLEITGGSNPLNPDDDAGGQTVSISLQPGWNMFSTPFQPNDANVTSVLSPIAGAYKAVWSYFNGQWQCYDPANPGLSDLETIEPGRGYWINMRTSGRLTVSGGSAASTVPLSKGWNLVGYNAAWGQPADQVLSSIADSCKAVWSFQSGQSGGWRLYDPENPSASDLDAFGPGNGYWIEARRDCQWELP